jgi:hypothetical protein
MFVRGAIDVKTRTKHPDEIAVRTVTVEVVVSPDSTSSARGTNRTEPAHRRPGRQEVHARQFGRAAAETCAQLAGSALGSSVLATVILCRRLCCSSVPEPSIARIARLPIGERRCVP